MQDHLSLGDVLAADELARNPTVLVTGPTADSVSGVPRAVVENAAGDGDGGLVVTNRAPGLIARDRLAEVPAIPRERLGVIDATPKDGGMTSNDEGLSWEVSSPADLTGTGIAISQSLSALERRGVERSHLLFDSLSTLQVSLDAERVHQFTHQLTYQRGYPAGVTVLPVYTNVTSDGDLEVLKHLADCMIRVRKRGGTRQVRCRGIPGAPAAWTPLSRSPSEVAAPASD